MALDKIVDIPRGATSSDSDEEDENFLKYGESVRASGGYDVWVYSGIAYGLIYPVRVIKVCEDGHRMGTDFEFVEVVKANAQLVSGTRYYITLTVTDGDGKIETFQAKVLNRIPAKKGDIDLFKVEECRIKPTTAAC